jgi:aspartyl-tRNA(Asn)/glutamyl-tRNA(Gln) amidotransferase subunit C
VRFPARIRAPRPRVERCEYFRHLQRIRLGEAMWESLLEVQELYDNHFLKSPAWEARRGRAVRAAEPCKGKPFHGHRPPHPRIGSKPHTLTPEDRCMPGITREEVAHLARLARLELKPEELDHFAGQLDDIIGAVARVSEVADQDVPPTSHPLPLTNVMRADEVRPSLTPEQALSGAPAQEQQRFKVPQILGEE